VRILVAQHFQQGEHADVLQQAGQHQFLGLAHAGVLAQQAAGQRGDHAAAPDALLRGRMGAGAAARQRKSQCQCQRGVQAEHGQRLRQVLDPPTAGVERGIGDAQHARAQGGVQADRIGGGRHHHFGILRQFDDAQRHARRAWQVAAIRQLGFEFGTHPRAVRRKWAGRMPARRDGVSAL